MEEIKKSGSSTLRSISEGTNYTVYLHRFPNKKVYIGITGQKPERRWKNGNGYKNKQPLMFRAVLKYGWESIEHEIVCEGLSKEQAESKEKELIKLYKADNPAYGYNVESGGNLSKTLSENTKEKLRRINLGKKHTEEAKKKSSESMKRAYAEGRKTLTEEHLKKMRAGRRYEKVWNKGLKVDTGRRVEQYTLSGEYVRSWMHGREVQEVLKIEHVYDVCNGNRKTAGGYVWRYADRVDA